MKCITLNTTYSDAYFGSERRLINGTEQIDRDRINEQKVQQNIFVKVIAYVR